MNPTLALPAPPASLGMGCAVAAYATCRASADLLPALRQKPAPRTGEPLPASFWKHADDQTVVSLAAVFDAIAHHGLEATAFADWGVLAAPRFLGRVALAAALNRFALEGAWGISPHLIPHRSLHSISGTISQALKIQGPNFGVGGGPNAAAEALFVAAGMVADERLPGVWLVMTGYDPEMAPASPSGDNGTALSPGSATLGAVALALTRASAAPARLRLRIGCAAEPPSEGSARGVRPSWPAFSLEDLLEILGRDGTPPAACWRLRGGWVELAPANASAER